MADVQPNAVVVERGQSKFVFGKCCFCVPLRTGCLILAYLQLVGVAALTVMVLMGISVIGSLYSRVSEDQRHIVLAILIFGVISIVLSIITLNFNILLVVGLHKGKRIYVKIYLIFGVVQLILSVLEYIAPMASGYAIFAWTELSITLVRVAITTYFLLVVRSQYVKMGEIIDRLPAVHYCDGHLVKAPKV